MPSRKRSETPTTATPRATRSQSSNLVPGLPPTTRTPRVRVSSAVSNQDTSSRTSSIVVTNNEGEGSSSTAIAATPGAGTLLPISEEDTPVISIEHYVPTSIQPRQDSQQGSNTTMASPRGTPSPTSPQYSPTGPSLSPPPQSAGPRRSSSHDAGPSTVTNNPPAIKSQPSSPHYSPSPEPTSSRHSVVSFYTAPSSRNNSAPTTTRHPSIHSAQDSGGRRPVTSEADLEPEADPDAANEVVEPEQTNPRGFWSVFLDQMIAEQEYFCTTSMLVFVVLAAVLLTSQVCSLGDICTRHRFDKVLGSAFLYQPLEYACLLIANILTFAGLRDICQGIVSVIGGIGVREAHREQPGLLDEDEDELDQNMRRAEEFPKAFLQDVCDKVMEPFLRLTLMFALRWFFDSETLSSSYQLVRVSVALYLIKWLSQTMAILYTTPRTAWFRPQNRIFVSVLVVLMAVVIDWQRVLSSFWEGKQEAEWFNNGRASETQIMGHVRVEHLPAGRTRPVRAAIHRVTNTVVTKWVTQALTA